MEERKMYRCFMTGHSCIYEKEIDAKLITRQNYLNEFVEIEKQVNETKEITPLSEKESNDDKNIYNPNVFVIRPFNSILNVLYELTVFPYLEEGKERDGESVKYHNCKPECAEDVANLGFIICEKVCKKIQEADLILADVSFLNANVFYELGLAVALRKEILLLKMKSVEDNNTLNVNHEKTDDVNHEIENGIHEITSNKSVEDRVKNLLNIEEIPGYDAFGYLNELIHQNLCNLDHFKQFERMSGWSTYIIHDGRIEGYADEKNGLFEYKFGSLCKSAAGIALAEITNKWKKDKKFSSKLEKNIKNIMTVEEIDCSSDNNNLEKTIVKLKNALCVIIDISDKYSIENYFWLGYLHGIGGNVIPINSTLNNSSSYQKKLNTGTTDYHSPDMVPFDIRALWHIKITKENQNVLSNELALIIKKILEDKIIFENKRVFWKNILEDNKVSIFTGSRTIDSNLKRCFVSEWDFRAASEITAYLLHVKDTIAVKLENPRRKIQGSHKINEIEKKDLEKKLKEGNCVIIGSSNVNDMTEIALRILFSFDEKYSKIKKKRFYKAFREYTEEELKKYSYPISYSYERRDDKSINNANDLRKGFFIYNDEGKTKEKCEEVITGPKQDPDKITHYVIRKTYGNLIVSNNPKQKGKKIIILNGISGTATLALAQLITGCRYDEFLISIERLQQVINDYNSDDIKYNTNYILKNFLKNMEDKIQDSDKFKNNIKNMPVKSNNEILSEYELLSEKALENVNEKIDENQKGATSFIIEAYVYEPKEKEGERQHEDDRQIICWGVVEYSSYALV